MTLDEAIKHAEEVAKDKEIDMENQDPLFPNNIEECKECAEEYRQLAEWLKELKDCRERIPSYEAGYNDAKREIALSGEYERAYERGKADAQPKTGHWITTRTFMHDGEYYCDRCKCDAPNNEKWDYCPNCGAKMEVSG